MNQWYVIQHVNTLDSPALVVYPKRVAENIHRMVSMVDDVNRLRPHIKTHKTAEGIRMMMEAGVQKFKCATIAEADLLGRTGAPDALLAYQPHGPKLLRLVQVIKSYPGTRYACLVDNRDSAAAMSDVFQAAGLRVPVYIDLNIGMNRTGIQPGEAVIDLYRFCAMLPGIMPIGLHAYDGHQRNPDIAQRTMDTDRDFQPVLDLQEKLGAAGFPHVIIIAGGSPSYAIHSKRPGRECSPGTCIFWDKGYSDLCPEQPFEPAVALVTRVVSLPTPTRVCLDLGHKAVAAENEITRRVYFPDAPMLKPVGQSEEHLVMEAPEGHGFRPGDVLYGIPYHICPTVALYDCLVVVEDGMIKGDWKIAARNR
ncbi:MAG: D-TA family PLP-dependent enzyme [Chitinophagaceae bacterium]|jgi:D-serine deaminase-like pyridoxal phosphate-dependent protein|nr:D-TA family PLP-dependent enzyme [Chitinophagaceae bacterium]